MDSLQIFNTALQFEEKIRDLCRVIVYEKKKTGCCGRCRDCKCHGKNCGRHRQAEGRGITSRMMQELP